MSNDSLTTLRALYVAAKVMHDDAQAAYRADVAAIGEPAPEAEDWSECEDRLEAAFGRHKVYPCWEAMRWAQDRYLSAVADVLDISEPAVAAAFRQAAMLAGMRGGEYEARVMAMALGYTPAGRMAA